MPFRCRDDCPHLSIKAKELIKSEAVLIDVRTKEEYNALKEKILINEKVSSISDLNTNSKEKFNQNKDFYDKING